MARKSSADPESPRTDPNAGVYPEQTASPSQQTPSAARPVRGSDPSVRAMDAVPSSDTLLSVPAPTSGDELVLDERLTAGEQRLTELEARVDKLERRPTPTSEAGARSYWFWLLFLAALAALWQIFERFR